MRRAVLTASIVLALVAGIFVMREATQNRPDPVVDGSETTIDFTVDTSRFRRGDAAAATALWAVCSATVGGSVSPVPELVGETWRVQIAPAIGEHGENRLVGCLEDVTIDRVMGDVVALPFEQLSDLHVHPPMTLGRVHARVGWLLPFAAGLFVVLALGAAFETLPWDRPITDAVLDARTPALDDLFLGISRLGSTPVVLAVAAAAAGFAWPRCRSLAIAIVVLALARPLVEFALKELVGRERPDGNRLVRGRGPSFPSGHPFATAASWGFVPLVVALYTRRRAYWWAAVIFAWTLAVLVAASRVWLGVHWASDAVGGLLLAALGVLGAERLIAATHPDRGYARRTAPNEGSPNQRYPSSMPSVGDPPQGDWLGTPFLRLERHGPLAHVVVDRPEARNALTPAMYFGLRYAVDHVARDPELVGLLVTGTGDVFMPGGDPWSNDDGWADLPTLLGMDNTPFDAVRRSPKPVVAAVNGICQGGGLVIAMLSDVAVASDRATFRAPELFRGIADTNYAQVLPRQIGPARARDMLMTGRTVSAQEAEDWGLVARVVPHDDLLAEAVAVLEQCCRTAPDARFEVKRVVHEFYGSYDRMAMDKSLDGPEPTEGWAAFRERRSPSWVHADLRTDGRT